MFVVEGDTWSMTASEMFIRSKRARATRMCARALVPASTPPPPIAHQISFDPSSTNQRFCQFFSPLFPFLYR